MTDRDKEIARLYTTDKLSVRMIAPIMGITLQRVHQVLKRDGVKMRPKHIVSSAHNYTGKSKERPCNRG